MTSSILRASALLLLLSGCIPMNPQRARDLPPDLSQRPPEERLLVADKDSPEFYMDCEELAARLVEVRADIASEAQVIQANQSQNDAQAAAGLVLSPVFLFMKDAPHEKQRFKELDEERERITRISPVATLQPASWITLWDGAIGRPFMGDVLVAAIHRHRERRLLVADSATDRNPTGSYGSESRSAASAGGRRPERHRVSAGAIRVGTAPTSMRFTSAPIVSP